MTIYYDYHIHCDNSPDCHESLDSMCLAACEKGMKEIMFTDHFEFYTTPNRSKIFTMEYLDKCFKRISEARNRYEDDIFIGYGVEFGQPHLQIKEAECILSDYPFDLVLASVHKIDDKELKFLDCRDTANQSLLDRYLDNVYEMVCSCDFDVLAHIDLVKRYFCSAGYSIRIEERPEMVDKILSKLAERKKGLEINTSGLRQGVKEALPGKNIVARFFELGGRIVTFGSDAHVKEDIGADFSTVSDFVPSDYELVSFRKRNISN